VEALWLKWRRDPWDIPDHERARHGLRDAEVIHVAADDPRVVADDCNELTR
jgi:hypothetical protein